MCSSCRKSPARRRKRRLGRRRSCPSSGEASRPPHPLLDVLLLGNSVADLFRAFTSIGPADHGKDVSLAGWAEDVRNLGGIAFLIVRQRAGTFQVTVKKSDADLFARASKIVRESVIAARGTVQPNRQVRNGWELVAKAADAVRDVAECTAVDGEVAWMERQEDVVAFLEGAVDHASERVRAAGKSDLELLGASPVRPKLPFKRVRYEEALEILRGQGKRLRDGDDIDTEAEKLLGQSLAKEGNEIYFLTGYTTSVKPFYVIADHEDPDSSRSFDLEFKGDEMASGGQREHRYDVLVGRMKEQGLTVENFDFYLKAFRYGMPPHGGWGFGVDRFVQKLLDLPNIREAILFPRDRTRLVP